MTEQSQPDRTIEYFYSAHSAFAYLGAAELARIAAETGWQVVHRPFDFWPVVRAAGVPGFTKRSAAHMGYFFGRELRRWAQWRDLPMIAHRPTHHDNPLDLASGMIMAAPDPDRLSFAILQAHWRDDADIADPDTLCVIARSCGAPDGLLDIAQSGEIRDRFAANTAEAIARTVFGSPTYFVRGDMFYGQDRLEMLARAIVQPFDP
jgi:2-hydroxychromene-2-carboxylate isomerase